MFRRKPEESEAPDGGMRDFSQLFFDRLKAEGISTDCGQCGNGVFAAVEPPLMVPFKTGESLQMLAVVCQRCGTVRMHAEPVVNRLLTDLRNQQP
ncbi:MAG TPA: hypothetical protein VFU51_01780 [Gaiellaceae bacterium]|nr:hypothetical protein [Gaiellaceae bacterium]